jgi:tetratricopeptide (TPR) repeat protein
MQEFMWNSISGVVVAMTLSMGTTAHGWQDRPGPASDAAEAPNLPQSLLDDPIDTFVPRVPRSERERDRLDALRSYVAARALEQRRLWQDSIDLLESARKKDPLSVPVMRRLARLYFGLGRIEEAVKTSREVLALDPQDAETVRLLVRYYRQSNEAPAAETLLEEVLANPSLPPTSTARLVVLHDLALLRAEQGEEEKAVEPLGKLLDALDAKDATKLSTGDQELILGDEPEIAYRRFGEIFFNARNYERSVVAFRRSLAYDPDNLQTPLLLTQALLRSGKAAEALALLDPIILQRPPGRLAFDVLAQILSALGREGEITQRFEAGRAADPKNVLLSYALAERYEKAGEVDRARNLYRQVISEQPDPQGIAALGDSLRNEGKYVELLQLFEMAMTQPQGRMAIEPQVKLIATDSNAAAKLLDAGLELLKADPPKLGPAGRLVLVEVATRSEQADKLIELDRLNLKLDPSPTTYSELATTLATAGKYAEAVAILTELRGKFPELADDSRIVGTLGMNQFQAGQVEASLETGKSMLARDPNDFVAIELIGFALNKLNRTDEAIKLYNDVLVNFADNPEATRLAHIWLSSVYSSRGEADKAEAELLTLLKEDPEDAWINNDLGYLWAERDKNLDQAEIMTRRAVTQEPENGSYLDSLGWVLFKRGKVDEAIQTLEKAAKVKKSDATILDHLGDAYYRVGRSREARDSWRKAQELLAKSVPPDKLLGKIQEKLSALGPVPDPAPDPNPNP